MHLKRAAWLAPLAGVGLFLAPFGRPAAPLHPPQTGPTPLTRPLALSFELNRGQTDRRVDFLARSRDGVVFLTGEGATFVVQGTAPLTRPAIREPPRQNVPYALRMRFLSARSHPAPQALQQLPGTASYFLGRDPANWHTGLPTYGKVAYRGVYDGVDVVYYGTEQHLEYDLVLAPGADASAIRLAFEGAERLSLGADGSLLVSVGGQQLIQRAPVAFQDSQGGTQPVAARYLLMGGNEVGFAFADHDTRLALRVDPTLVYSTYLGTIDDQVVTAIAVDGSGNAYLTGLATTTFPTTRGALQQSRGGATDAFVMKLSAAGVPAYSTYLGGTGDDVGQGIAVDGSGGAYVTGSTSSTDFPTTAGALQPANAGARDAFIAHLNSAGTALISSTYLGGAADDAARAIAVDAAGDVFVAGDTESTSFPTTSGAFQTQNAGGTDAFVAKLSAAGTLAFGSYLGGTSQDSASSLAIDAAGNVYVAGFTTSRAFPTTAGARQPSFVGGPYDGFVTRLNATGTSLTFSTYLGGTGNTYATALALDAAGDCYVAGYTDAADLGTTPGVVQPAIAGGSDGFLAELNPTASAFVFATYLGGDGEDGAFGLAVDAAGNSYLTGFTDSSNFPTSPNALLPTNVGNNDAFIAKVGPAGTSLGYSTYLGGSFDDFGYGVAADSTGHFYVAGYTKSFNFPVTTTLHPDVTLGNQGFISAFDATGTPVYSLTLGGSDQSYAYGVAVDGAGSAYLAGGTYALNFPTTPGCLQPSSAGGEDAIVAKLTPDGAAFAYVTYLGGSSDDLAAAIAVDARGNAYVAGFTGSTDFPSTAGAAQPNSGGSDDGFVLELNPTGVALVYSTYLGGTRGDYVKGLALDASGNAYVAGYTGSTDFPVTAGAFQPHFGGGVYDAFMTRVSANGSALSSSTYLGGSGDDLAYGITLDSAGAPYVVGATTSVDFPLASPLQPTSGGGYDAFVSKLNPAATALTYSTYVGGSAADYAHAIAVDAAGNAYVAGYAVSTDFPVTAGAFQSANAGDVDIVVFKLSPSGKALIYSTYLGGFQEDVVFGIAVDDAGSVLIAGSTASSDFPVTSNALQGANAGANDAVLSVLSPDGKSLRYSSYLGGTSSDYAYGLARTASGQVWLAGQTLSVDFPTTAGSVEPALSSIQYQDFLVEVDLTQSPVDGGVTPGADGGGADSGGADAGTSSGKPPRGCGCGEASPATLCAWMLALLGGGSAISRRRRKS